MFLLHLKIKELNKKFSKTSLTLKNVFLEIRKLELCALHNNV